MPGFCRLNEFALAVILNGFEVAAIISSIPYLHIHISAVKQRCSSLVLVLFFFNLNFRENDFAYTT